MDEVAAHFGRIDFLVNNAAGNFMCSVENLTPNGFKTVLGIDLQGVFHMSKVIRWSSSERGKMAELCLVIPQLKFIVDVVFVSCPQASLPHLKKTGATDGAVIINITAFLQDFATPFQVRRVTTRGIIEVSNAMVYFSLITLVLLGTGACSSCKSWYRRHDEPVWYRMGRVSFSNTNTASLSSLDNLVDFN